MRRYKTIDFDSDPFTRLLAQVRQTGADPVKDQASFLISVEGAAAFYRHAVLNLGGIPKSDDPCSDVVFKYHGVPVRVRAALTPPESVAVFPPAQLAEWDTYNPPPRWPRSGRWC